MIYVRFPATTLAWLLSVSHGTSVQEQCVAEFREDLETHHAPVEVSLCAKLCFYSCIVMDVSRPRTKLSMFGAVGRTSAVLSKVFRADISQYVMPCSIRISV
jgi:hypothetical protein